MKKPEPTPLHELGGDAWVARVFRWLAIIAAVLTVIVVASLLIWWWLSSDAPVMVEDTAVLAQEPLAHPGSRESGRGATSDPAFAAGNRIPYSLSTRSSQTLLVQHDATRPSAVRAVIIQGVTAWQRQTSA